jgi:hypothetical protein
MFAIAREENEFVRYRRRGDGHISEARMPPSCKCLVGQGACRPSDDAVERQNAVAGAPK